MEIYKITRLQKLHRIPIIIMLKALKVILMEIFEELLKGLEHLML